MRRPASFTVRPLLAIVAAIALSVIGVAAPATAASGLSPADGVSVHVYASDVNVRHGGTACTSSPSTSNCPTIGAEIGPANETAICQKAGQTISDGGYSSNYWTWIALRGGSGFVSNVYITGAAHLAGVPDCGSGEPTQVSVYASSVNVRHGGSACNNSPSTTNCPTISTTVTDTTVSSICQQSGQTISSGGNSSSYWTWVVLPGAAGFVSNVYITGAAHLSGIPDCVKAPTVTAPGAPTGVTATAGDGQATVKWAAPSSNGGAAISKYTVTASPGGKTATSTTTSATVTGLTNGTGYTFTVTATNSAGTGPASSASNKVTPTGTVKAPGAPTGVTATAGDGQATVKWTAPSSDGGAAISKYTVTSSPGGKTATSTATTATVTGLTNGTGYTFTVTATNSAGPGPASSASNQVTPASGPPPVTSKPQTTNSHYVRNESSGSDVSTAKSEGAYDAKQASPNPSLILLSYGNQIEPPNAGASETGSSSYTVTDSDIVNWAEAYLDGWESVDSTSSLKLVISTNNDNGWIADDATAAGKDWATNVINPVMAYAKTHAASATISAGMDIEDWQGDGSPSQTKAWLQELLSDTTADFVNHGAASACPIPSGDPSSNGSCEYGWTQADYFALSGGISPSRISVLPQIYNDDMDNQWENIDLYGTSNGMTKLNFAGVLSENRANSEDSGSNSDISPTAAWNNLWNQLQSNSTTKQASLPYSTDLFDDSKTQTPPPIS